MLPLAAIAFEAASAILTNFIDPMPSVSYVFLLLSVPACHAMAWLGLKRDAFHHSRWYAAMTGFSAAIALFYSILLIPIMPFAAVCMIVLLGILGFAPVLALWTAIRLMRAWAGFTGLRPIAWGAVAGFTTLVALAAPAIGLRAGAGMLESQYQWVRDAGYSILNTSPVSQELLESCEWTDRADARTAVALLTGRGGLGQEEARRLYYRVTGQAYDQQPVSHWRRRSWMQFDEQRGGDRVGRHTADVQLTASRLDGKLDARAAAAYLEWTMAFHNSGATQQEARTEIALPPGGVVSRVTLWVHGEEREAAFGGQGQTRQAYENVVKQRRDPLLVTSSGRDRVLVQCFPIEPGNEMKIRLGVTAPVLPEGSSDRGLVTLPTLVTENFEAQQPAWVWLESVNPVMAAVGKLEATGRDGTYVLRGPIQLRERTAIRVAGMTWPTTWTPDVADDGAHSIEQRFIDRTVAPPDRAVLVMDGSESTRALRGEIDAVLKAIPANIEKRVIVATRTGVSAWLPSMPWGGGVDAAPALELALSSADGGRRTAVVWIAGTQPVKIAGSEVVRQVLERGRGEPRLFVLAAGGENVLLRDLNGLPGVQSIPRLGSAADDLRRVFEGWHPGGRERVAERRAVPASDVPRDAVRGGSHVVRLWAAEEAARAAETNRRHAVDVAAAHQIVTPWTGAVVLETAAQYQQNELKPAESGSTPSITPEPGTWVLIAIGVLGLLVWRARSESRSR
jgi:hypothetical protein